MLSSSSSRSFPDSGVLTAHIVAVGDELVVGSQVDTNSARIGQTLTRLGYRVLGSRSVLDDPERIAAALAGAAEEADLVLVTGGLGPTEDDRTREGLALWAGVSLEERAEVLAWLEALFSGIGRRMSPSNRLQALVPGGFSWMKNPAGTAPALLGEHAGSKVVALPGVPREVTAFLAGELGAWLARQVPLAPRPTLRLRTCGIAESSLADLLHGVIEDQAAVSLAFLPSLGGVDLVLSTAPGNTAPLDRAVRAVRERAEKWIYGEGEDSLAMVTGRCLLERGATVAVAESCTGGAVMSMLTDPPGASGFFLEGAVTYSNASKIRLLGVKPESIAAHGAVSEPVAREMAAGIRRVAGATFGLATTGIAGPSGGTPEKPVGTVFIACASEREVEVLRVRFAGDRLAIRTRAAYRLVDLLRRTLAFHENRTTGD